MHFNFLKSLLAAQKHFEMKVSLVSNKMGRKELINILKARDIMTKGLKIYLRYNTLPNGID